MAGLGLNSFGIQGPSSKAFTTVSGNYLNSKSRQSNSPKYLNIAQKAMIFHTFGVQVLRYPSAQYNWVLGLSRFGNMGLRGGGGLLGSVFFCVCFWV